VRCKSKLAYNVAYFNYSLPCRGYVGLLKHRQQRLRFTWLMTWHA